MKYTENHPKEIIDKVNLYEEKHIAYLKRKLESPGEFKEEYIYEKILSGIYRKKINLETFHPGSDRYLENIFLRIRQKYYEIIDKYKEAQISKLNGELEAIKSWITNSYNRNKYSEPEFARAIAFINSFSIYQAINFIVRDIVYEKMINNPVFLFSSKQVEEKISKPKLGTTKMDDSHESSDLSLIIEDKFKEMEDRISVKAGAKEMLDAQGAADFTGYKLNTIRQKTSERKIPFHKLPNSSAVRYSKTELLEWMQNGNTPSKVSLLENIANGIRKRSK